MTTELAAPPIGLRPGRSADALACAEILNGWIDTQDWMPRVHSPAAVRRFYSDVVFPTRRVWVAGDPVRGFLALDDATNLITALYVAGPGNGIGRALLDQAKQGREYLELWAFQANIRACAFYMREGFVECRRTEGDNEEGLPDILFRWERGAP